MGFEEKWNCWIQFCISNIRFSFIINEVAQIKHLRVILTIFEGISGLHVNWSKSFLFPINQDVRLPVGAKNKELEVWNEVMERCEKSLSRWKSQYQLLGGRFRWATYLYDVSISNTQEHYEENQQNEKILHLAREQRKQRLQPSEMRDTHLSRKQGDLGMRNLSIQNNCLLQKCVWKIIRRLWPQFSNNIYTNVGNGLKTYFWNEIWKGDDSLRNLFPNLYTLSLQRFATVAQVWGQQGWNLVFRRTSE
ncbi:hypothetical protein H5410_007127 [Solanum commersonii]|uniref:Uncharacterized protein n=1 Tax=Solanum commersonii TaxID=4109 RepID=A0A9J6AB82_SOLCO|nr:hypothetical protein H5410_007127 [Solanum commersonii]